MEGTIRSYDKDTLRIMKERIQLLSTNTAAAYNCKAEVNIIDYYPATVNHKDSAQHVMRLAKKYIGEEHTS